MQDGFNHPKLSQCMATLYVPWSSCDPRPWSGVSSLDDQSLVLLQVSDEKLLVLHTVGDLRRQGIEKGTRVRLLVD